MMSMLMLMCNGLACPVEESTLAQDIVTIRQTTGHKKT